MNTDDSNASDQTESTEETTETVVDPIKNFKSEISRKIENQNAILEKQNREINERLAALTASVSRQTPEAPLPPSKKMSDLMYDNPEEYARIIAENATNAATKVAARMVETSTAQQNDWNTTVAQLQNEYPEFQKNDSELTKRTLEIYNTLSANEKNTGRGIKSAAREAAAELGIVTASRRTRNNTDDFSVGSSGSSNRQQAKKADAKIDQASIEFARLLGQPVDDPKYIERLKKSNNRKNYGKYE